MAHCAMAHRAIALLIAFGLPWAPATAQRAVSFAERVADALERARPVLRRDLARTEGSPLALLCLAAAHDELPRDDRIHARALERLARTQLVDTYGLSLRLMVLAAVQDFPDRDALAAQDTERLLLHRARAGGFSYSPRPADWDLSNTQYAALGLRAAVHLGQDVPREVWHGLADAALAARRDGGFGYRDGGSPTMSMTVAGIAILELCKQQLAGPQVDTAVLDAAVAAGWEWLDARTTTIGDLDAWHALYAHYGLERAAVLSGREQVGGEDWYVRGGTAILRAQRGSGVFVGRQTSGDARPVDHAFAILFLRRAFRRELTPRGPTTPGPTPLCHQLPAGADPDAVRRAVELDVARGDAAVPDLLRALRDPLPPRRRAAAIALLRISGADFRYHPGRDDAANAEAVRRAEAWWAARQRDRAR